MIEIIISTINDGIRHTANQFLPESPSIRYLIVHQDPDNKFADIPLYFHGRNDVRYRRYIEKGLPRSRNRGLENATGDILLPTDDDVFFIPEGLGALVEAFERNPSADIITFMAQLPRGGFFKSYRTEAFDHTQRTLLQVSSIEIAIRRTSAAKLGLRWDEDFGLGAKYGGGLEVVFLQECLKRGARIRFEPIPAVIHPPESSGRRLDAENALIRGAVFSRIFGSAAPLYSLAFALRKARDPNMRVSSVKYFLKMLEGIRRYRRDI